MSEFKGIPSDLQSCQELIVSQQKQIEELQVEQEKLRKLLSQLLNGNRSEKRVFSGPDQILLPFESEEEYQAAQAEAEAEAETIIAEYTVQRRARKKKPRDESLPSHLERVEQIVDAPEEMKNCPQHGEREVIGYDITETLMRDPPRLWVLRTMYPKYACPTDPSCGVASPERPTSLVEGNRYDTSIAAAIIEAKWALYLPIYRQQDLFASSGWMPSRSTLLNLIHQSQFVIEPLVNYMTELVQQDVAIGLDETSCRMLLPKDIPEVIPGDTKSMRLAEKVAEARAAGKKSLLAKMWVYSGLFKAPYNIFDFRVSRHRDGPDEFLKTSRCKVQGDCFSGNTSVVLQSDGRLEFVACWSHARRKVDAATSYPKEAEQLLRMIQALYDIETRAKDLPWKQREELRGRESSVVLAGIKKWLDTPAMDRLLPKSDFAEAVRYIRNHWTALNVFVHDGRIPIDNNEVEQLMKQVALGRKAWLFVGNVDAGQRSAMMMTLVSSAKRHDLDVGLYIKDVLDQLLAGCTDYAQLLPDQWKQRHPEAVRQYRQEERRDKADRKQHRAAQRRLANRQAPST
jgi:transposase